MKKLLSSEDSGVGMSGCNDPIVEMAMTAFSSLMLLAVQIDNKNEEEQKTAISKQMDSGRISLKSLLPGMKTVNWQSVKMERLFCEWTMESCVCHVS